MRGGGQDPDDHNPKATKIVNENRICFRLFSCKSFSTPPADRNALYSLENTGQTTSSIGSRTGSLR